MISGFILKNTFLFLMAAAISLILIGCSQVSPALETTSAVALLEEQNSEITAVFSATPPKTKMPEATRRMTITPTSAVEIVKTPPPLITTIPTTVVTIPVTPTPTIASTTEPSPTTEPDRSCPETVPLKPEYDRFYLSANLWPEPDNDIAEPHFWLSKPLPGGGRTLINQRFPYGWDENGRLLLHNGVDIAENLGTPVLAVADGTVVVAQADLEAWYGWRCDWYGHLVVIELDQRWQDQPIFVLYGHVLNLMVDVGDRVLRDQPVAEVGFGGAATNPHLHVEVRVGENEFGSTRNPMLWIDPGPSRGIIVGRLVDPDGRPWQGVPLALAGRNGTAGQASTWSYLGDPQHLINSDEGWAENFLFSDIQPGEYDIYTSIQGVDYRQPVTVIAGKVSVVEITTEALKPAAPIGEVTAEPTNDDLGN